MDEERSGGPAALGLGALVGLVTYVLVAPFRCSQEGSCEGLVAFEYGPKSAGHWQAVGAGAVLGTVAALLLWLVLATAGPSHTTAKVVATPFVVAGIAISLLSQSILLIVGPVVGGTVLWLMWGSGSRSKTMSNRANPLHSWR